MAVIIIGLSACDSPVDPGPVPQTGATGSISGKAQYKDADSHAGITVTIEKTNGLLSNVAVMAAKSIGGTADPVTVSRSIQTARAAAFSTQTGADGNYSFSNVEPGIYTVYASSSDTRVQAVKANGVIVKAGESATADLNLTPVGNISGKVEVDDGSGDSFGFLVSVAGTSYMATTGTDGSFTISGVPAGSGYTILLIKGAYTDRWSESSVSVSGWETTTLDPAVRGVASSDLGNGGDDDGGGIVWKGELDLAPSSPQTNWAYFDTVKKTSFIWNGYKWDILAAQGGQGEKGEDGQDGAPGSVVTIGDDGYWYINDVNTYVKAQGPQGESGAPGSVITIVGGYWYINGVNTDVKAQGENGAPGSVVTIEDDGYWYIDGENTNVKAQGPQGAPGSAGTLESVITLVDGYWYIDGKNTNVKAQGPEGPQGQAGEDGAAGSVITIVEGYWYINGENTNVKAQGPQGPQGEPGENGTPGSVITIIDGYWYIDGINTNIKAQGPQGESGESGAPGSVVTIEDDGYWYIDGENTNVKAMGQQGPQGEPGENGTPGSVITIVGGYWYINGINTNVKAQGPQGQQGEAGAPGSVITIVGGYWYINGVNTNILADVSGGTNLMHSVAFNSGGGSLVPSQYVAHNGKAARPSNPVWSGYTFNNWYSDSTLTTVYNFNNPVMADIMIYAKWTYSGALPITDVSTIGTYLAGQSGGTSADNPVNLPIKVDPTQANWLAILNAVNSGNKYVSLDLSLCILSSNNSGGGLRNDGSFDPMASTAAGKTWIVSVTLPNAATTLVTGGPSFKSFTVLRSVSGSNITAIGSNVFTDCTTLTTVTFPRVSAINADSFKNCPIKTIELGLSTIDNFAATYLTDKTLLESASFPQATSIGGSAFRGCTNLITVSVPKATSIGGYAFDGCTSLALTALPAGVTSIGDGAFQNCTSLALTALPAGVTSIGSSAFYNCSKLALTTIPVGITSIGGRTFYNCTSLTQITLPASLNMLDIHAFYGCANLKLVICNAATPPSGNYQNNYILDNTHPDLVIRVPSASVAAYKAHYTWSPYAARIVAQ